MTTSLDEQRLHELAATTSEQRSLTVRISFVIFVVGFGCLVLGALGGYLATNIEVGRVMQFGALAFLLVLVALAVGAAAISTMLTRDVRQVVKAVWEILQGRNAAAALEGAGGDAESAALAGAVKEMATRVEQVDARDRRFLMSISHELRTPLTAITGHSQALADGLAEDPAARQMSLQVIEREAGRLERLVNDIIDLTRIRSNRFHTVDEEVDLVEIGEQINSIFSGGSSGSAFGGARAANSTQKNGSSGVEVQTDFDHILIHSDGGRILQIIRNLVGNALRYAETHVVVRAERVSNTVRVTVANDGPTIPETERDNIFEPFVGTKREGGLGLGLAISRELSWALGGDLRCIECSSGALFELTLPLEQPGSGR